MFIEELKFLSVRSFKIFKKTKHGQNGTQVIIEACSSSLLMLVDHQILWKFKASGSSLLDDLCIDGHLNVKPKRWQSQNFPHILIFMKNL